MSVVRFSVLAAVLLSCSAWAQLPPVTISSQPYVPLSGPGVVSLTKAAPGGLLRRPTGTFAETDEGYLPLQLQFSFPYFGQSFNSVFIDVNGFLQFDTTTPCANWSQCGSSRPAFPAAGAPNGLIAGFWADFDMDANSALRYLSTPGELIVEWSAMPPFLATAASPRVTFQVRITPSGMFTIHHDVLTTTGLSGPVGFENVAGSQGANLISGCTSACGFSNWVPNRFFQIGEPEMADLGVTSVTVANFNRLPDDNLTFNVNATIRNYGRTSTDGGFEWAAYLSRDRVLDLAGSDAGADILVATGTSPEIGGVMGGVLADGGQAISEVTGMASTSTPPPTGEYYVLVQADSTNVVAEASETNNVGSTATAFVQGVDLVAVSVSGPTASSAGSDAGVNFSFTNRGTSEPDSGVPYRVLLSADNLLDTTDLEIADGVSTGVTGGQTVTGTITFAMPARAPAGEFFYLLQVDPPTAARPNGIIEEATETNNWVASTGKVTITRPDIVMESVVLLDPVTNLPTTSARFGEAVRLRTRFRNAGQATANNFLVGLVLSTDASLSLQSDVLVCTSPVATLAPSTTATELILDCTLPLENRGTPYATGAQYYVFGLADATSQVFETNEQNNSQVVGPLRITAPGPDLAVTSVSAPAAAGVGEIAPVTRSIKNLGNRDAPEVSYRYVASANEIITSDDVPLRIVDGANSSADGKVTLAAGASDTKTELVQLPTTMPAGTYYIGVIVDPSGSVTGDLEPTNNALGARATAVAPPSLRVTNTALPDAIIGRPYSYRLSAAGEQGASTWSIDSTLGSAPSWLQIGATDGLLTGTPTGTTNADVVGVTVRLENAGRIAVARLALRVLPTSSGLEVTTLSLPAIVNSSNTQYDYKLGAVGGVLPYSWRITAGTLPTGITLTAAGQLVGTPRNTPNGTTQVTVEVRDAVGSRATRQLPLRLVPAGAISFRTISIPDAIVGQEYLQDIAVYNLDMSAVARPLSWRVSGVLPSGLSATPQSELITIAGRPTQAGTFSFTISVEDNNGRSDQLTFTMTVHAPRYRVIFTPPDVLVPGEEVNLPLSVTPSGTVTYRLVNGSLPPGLSLDAAGAITGTVATENADGTWAFVLEARDAAGQSGVTALALRVERQARTVSCSTVDPSLWMLGLGALALLRRRRR